MRHRWFGTAILATCLIGSSASAGLAQKHKAQTQAQNKTGQGGPAQSEADRSSFLVARPELSDPLFEQSVVLMLPVIDKYLVVGLIVNKPTRITLSQVFPKISAFKDRTDKVYFGGPVDVKAPGAIFRSTKSFKQAFHLTGDLYVTFDSNFIESILKGQKKEVSDMRLFIGRAQWGTDQLGGEMEDGSWYGAKEANTVIFSADPDLWKTLIAELEPGVLAEFTIDSGRAKERRI
ncbi:MAG TPA: YqgE/AlgH family protein [Candidatus Aquilonibacter sp.]|nr:YqgE/AlgH family protein [Candidatus Aquilonibacter sp.]